MTRPVDVPTWEQVTAGALEELTRASDALAEALGWMRQDYQLPLGEEYPTADTARTVRDQIIAASVAIRTAREELQR